jgi:hypothetical protein
LWCAADGPGRISGRPRICSTIVSHYGDINNEGAIMKIQTSIALLLCASAAVANPAQQRAGEGGQRQGPPPEALTACQGKTAGATVEMKTPRGDLIKGTCRMVMIPERDGGRQEPGRERQRQPQR